MDDFKHSRVSTFDLAKPKRIVNRYNTVTKQVYQSFEPEVESGNGNDAEVVKKPKASARYFGALVADAHNVITNGGLYAYPGTAKTPNGKIRLLYEANPMAMIFEQGGGMASNGNQRILDLPIPDIHTRTPIFIGPNPCAQ
jgi:fructose-1,6-bisphosphatase I